MRQNLALPGVAVAPRSDPKALAPRRWLGSSNQVLQTKLRVGAVDDPLEREADRVADAVVAGAAPPPMHVAPAAPQRKCAACATNEEKAIQRKCEDCEAEENETVRRKAADASAPARDGGAEAAAAVAGGGAPLSADVRSYFEPRFGRDLSGVRVHADSAAAQAAQAIDARAFTLGHDIAFAPGEYAPGTRAGRRLIAHELAHVAQQSDGSSATIRRWAVRDCRPPQEEYINEAVTRGHADLTRVLGLINERPVTPQVRSALWLAFRDDSDSTLALVTGGIALLQRNLIHSRFACRPSTDETCAQGYEGYTYGGGGHCPETPNEPAGNVLEDNSIYLCIPAFSDEAYNEQSRTVIHEAAHLYLGLCDTGYFAAGCQESLPGPRHRIPQDRHSGTIGDNPVFRLLNADAYSCFVHFLIYSQADALNTSATEFRGDRLRIEAPSTEVFTRTSAPSDPTFTLTGVPNGSGFRFRWYLQAGADPDARGVQYQLEERRGRDTGVLNEDVTAVNVSSAVRGLLESNGVSRATIVCEIELFRPFGDRFPPPLLVRRLPITVTRGLDPFDISNLF